MVLIIFLQGGESKIKRGVQCQESLRFPVSPMKLFFCGNPPFRQDLERVIEDVRRQAKIEAHSSLGGETKRIAGENKRLAKELRFQMQVCAFLFACRALNHHRRLPLSYSITRFWNRLIARLTPLDDHSTSTRVCSTLWNVSKL